MGIVNSGQKKISKLKEDEISKYEKETLFTAHEVLMLHKAYRQHCLSDGTLAKDSFVNMFSIYNKSAKAMLFLDHIFRTWDFGKHGNLSKRFSSFRHRLKGNLHFESH